MKAAIDWLLKLNADVNEWVWGPPMLVLLIGAGIYIAIRTRFVQFRKFGLMSRETMGRIFRRGPAAEGDITPFQAMTVAMGGTVGVGNIAGVATAIAAGGPGAVFWMLMSGLLGMGTKYAEVVLGQHYRRRELGGPMVGGPMMYITYGLGRRWKPLAMLFCFFGAVAGLGIGNMTQAHAVSEGVQRLLVETGLVRQARPATAPTSGSATAPATGPAAEAARPPQLAWARWITGGVLLLAVGLVTVGGIKRIAHVAMIFVPFMCIGYLLAAMLVIILYAGRIPAVLALIMEKAFTPQAAVGGFAGAGVWLAMRYGFARGVFSNEAGLGSAPMAHATAQTDHPCRQGLWGIFEVFVDTIIICFATALVILLTGAWESGEKGANLTITAFGKPFGAVAGCALVTGAMIMTAYDTILAWCFYGETCCASLLGHGRVVRMGYRLAWLPFILLGALGRLEDVWTIADTLNGLMALPNLIALLALTGVVVKLTKGFLAGQPYQRPP